MKKKCLIVITVILCGISVATASNMNGDGCNNCNRTNDTCTQCTDQYCSNCSDQHVGVGDGYGYYPSTL